MDNQTDPLQTEEARKLRQRLIEVKRKKLDWIKRHRIYFHKPLELPRNNQAAYHACKKRIRLVVGTNRSGKTTSGAVDDISFCLGFYPWLLPEEYKALPIEEVIKRFDELPESCKTPFRPPVKVWVIVADWDIADDIWTKGKEGSAGKLALYVPPGALQGRPRKNQMGHICEYTFINGSILAIDTEKSYVNNPNSFEGRSAHKFHYDEPPNRGMRIACARGLVDTRGFEDFTMTPISEPWIKSEIADKEATDENIATFFFDTEDNPHVSAEGWRDFISKLNEDEVAARARGEWLFLRGLVYKEFVPRLYDSRFSGPPDRNGNLCKPLPPAWIAKNATLVGAIDPHPRNPHAVLFLAADRHGRWIVWREIYQKSLVSELVDRINAELSYLPEGKTAVEQLQVFTWICDPLAFTEDPIDGRTWADEFIDLGIPIEKAPKRREQGILDVKQALREKRLLVCNDCHRTIWEFQNYQWDEYRDDTRSKKEKPKDKDDHLMECLYRCVLMQPTFVDQSKPTKPINAYSYV